MTNKTLLIALAILTYCSEAIGQINYGGEPYNWNSKHVDFSAVNKIEFPTLDMEEIQAEDEVTDQYKETPYRFGISHEVEINILQEASSFETENGISLFQFAIECETAKSISMFFGTFNIPKGGEMYIWNSDRSQFLGKFDHRSGIKRNALAIGLIKDSKVMIEFQVPTELLEETELVLNEITQGYRSIINKFEDPDRGPFGSSGACNINVNCDEANEWQTEKRSVALIVQGGSAQCSGALVNNTNNDGTPYFLTANHCLSGQVGSWVFYFNHEHEDCNGSTGPTNQSISGSELIASNGGSDFALLLLDEDPPADFNVQFAGWDATDVENVTEVTGIHHPAGDVKKICFDEDGPEHGFNAGAQTWYIDEWELGVTEGGSSGSPLFDQNHRIIGQLYGGFAACSGSVNNGQADWYGRFGVSWDGNSPNSRLRDWLDPSDSGTLVLDGFPEGFALAENDVSNSGVSGINSSVCGLTIYPSVTIRNGGTEALTSCTVEYSVNGGPLISSNWTGNLAQDETEEYYIGAIGVSDDENTFEVIVSNPNGVTDENTFNNTYSETFYAFGGDIYSFNIEILLDEYGSETTWEIKSGNDVYYTGGPYADDPDDWTMTTVNEIVCIGEGCYSFVIYDSEGDGLCCGYGDGSYTVYSQFGGIAASGGEFDDFEFSTICTPPISVDESNLEESLSIYPNPMKDFFTIESHSGSSLESMILLDLTGKTILNQENLNTNSQRVNLNGISAGVYLLEVEIDGQRITKKVIIE